MEIHSSLPKGHDTIVELRKYYNENTAKNQSAKKLFERYLADLPSVPRQDLRRNLRRFEAAGLRIKKLNDSRGYGELLYELYLPYYQRAKFKDVQNSVVYFDGLGKFAPQVTVIVAIAASDKIHGFVAAHLYNGWLHGGSIGVEQKSAPNAATYFRLLYALIELALRRGHKGVVFGPSAYRVKRCVGAKHRPMAFLFAGAKNKKGHLLEAAMRVFGRQILSHLEDDNILESSY